MKERYDARSPRFIGPGLHTAHGDTVEYRLGKVASAGVLRGEWLDCGCAEGFYSNRLAERGATRVVGVDVIRERVLEAESRPHHPAVTFQDARAEELPFADASFDGVLLNEVLEHVADEHSTLSELLRVLRPGGHVALFSPNRWFPFEGHGIRINDAWSFWHPVPLLPWLPGRLTGRFQTARNYWPSELCRLVSDAGFEVVDRQWALARFEHYAWLPRSVIGWLQRESSTIERTPIARFLAVSTFVLGRKPRKGLERVGRHTSASGG